MFYIIVLYFIFVDNTHIGNEDERLISFEEDRILCNENYENESVAMENGVRSSILQSIYSILQSINLYEI